MSYMKEVLIDILEMHELGATTKEISESLNVDVALVKEAIKNYGEDFK